MQCIIVMVFADHTDFITASYRVGYTGMVA